MFKIKIFDIFFKPVFPKLFSNGALQRNFKSHSPLQQDNSKNY